MMILAHYLRKVAKHMKHSTCNQMPILQLPIARFKMTQQKENGYRCKIIIKGKIKLRNQVLIMIFKRVAKAITQIMKITLL